MINKAALMRAINKTAQLSYREAALCVDIIIETITGGIIRGERVELRELGSFSVRKIAARKTPLVDGAVIPAHGRIVFRPCQKLRESVWNCESLSIKRRAKKLSCDL
jgi:nucleoid DNA-binding protein